jgi:hypothetical protein|nr:hypothetical protein [uncultured Rhodopila sp.]
MDLRSFPGVDAVRDATLPFDDLGPLDLIYSEHFLEHLSLSGAVRFFENALTALAVGGKMRISTPSLEMVLMTHFNLDERNPMKRINSTLGINRAFHGWGHQFLWSGAMLEQTMLAVGYQEVALCEGGQSTDPLLSGLELRPFRIVDRLPDAWIAEGTKGTSHTRDESFFEMLEAVYNVYIRNAH